MFTISILLALVAAYFPSLTWLVLMLVGMMLMVVGAAAIMEDVDR